MSGFRRGNRGGGRQPYNHHAKRLREKLNSREHEHDEEAGNSKFRHPAGLRGKEIGLWYAKNKPTHSQLAEDSKLVRNKMQYKDPFHKLTATAVFSSMVHV